MRGVMKNELVLDKRTALVASIKPFILKDLFSISNFLCLSVLFFIVNIPGFCFSARFYDSGIQPVLSCSQNQSGQITIRMQLGEYYISDSGDIRLNSFWNKHRLDVDQKPHFVLPLRLNSSSEYEVEVLGQTNSSQKLKAILGRPYIYRDIRGVDLIVEPDWTKLENEFINSEIEIRVSQVNFDVITTQTNPTKKLNPYFVDNYRQHFINFSCKYEDIGETGSLLIICYDGFMSQILPYVNWKKQKGIPCSLVPISQVGSTPEQIRSYIQNIYETDPNLTFVQLVGDHAQVPSYVDGAGNTYGVRDPYYSILEGDDYYPEVFVARFSAESASELETQIIRSIEYEKNLISGNWLNRAAGVCAENPPIPGDDNEHNWEHLDNIRDKLLNFTYTQVDRIYANEGADTQNLAASINAGKSLINYCGEGYETYWITPEFHNEDVYQLTNDNMLPFIHVVSCMTGQFGDYTCLAEAFMRAMSPATSQPTGAIGIYASAPHQGISPPMRSQDHFIDLLINGTKNTLGGLCYNGSCNMLDVYGVYGGEHNFMGWNLFGDASLQLRTDIPQSLNVAAEEVIPAGTTSLSVQTGKADVQVCLSYHNNIIASGFTGADGALNLNWTNPSVSGNTYLLTCTGFNCITSQQEVLCYTAGETFLTLSEPAYTDNEDNIISSNEVVRMSFDVTNPTQVTANDVWLELVHSDTLLICSNAHLQLGSVQPNQLRHTYLDFIINKNCPDYRLVEFEIKIHCGTQFWSFPYNFTVHTPQPRILSVKLKPAVNWLNPGDEAYIEYKFKNFGSAKLQNTECLLTTNKNWVQILQSQKTINTILSDSVYTLLFPYRIKNSAPTNVPFEFNLIASPHNSPDFYHSQNHLVIPSGAMMDSFEDGLNAVFTWEFPTSSWWNLTTGGVDGKICLQSPNLTPNLTSSVQNSFIYKPINSNNKLVFYLKTGAVQQGVLRFYINGFQQSTFSGITDWQKAEYDIAPGLCVVKWVYDQIGDNTAGEGFACLDAIQFPAGSVFADAILDTDTEVINITIHPNQVIYTPIVLKSQDGRFIDFQTILLRDRAGEPKDEVTRLKFNRTNFTPGSIDRYLVKLYNPLQDMVVTQVNMNLPENTLAISASNFSFSGQQPLTCVSVFPALNSVLWSNETGTQADSLQSVITLVSDISCSTLSLHYTITLKDAIGVYSTYENDIVLTTDSIAADFLQASPNFGSLVEQQTERLTLSCVAANLPQDLSGYRFVIYYNGLNSLSLPVNLSYDPTPGIETDKLKLRIFPNPFTDYLRFDYYLPKWDKADFSVYNTKGQKVADLSNAKDYPGQNLLIWDGKDKQGHKVANGIYFIRLKTNESGNITTLCLLMK